MRKMPVFLFALMLAPLPALSQTDPFLAAVGFALTGSDNAKLNVLDRKRCVFQIGKEIFRLNGVEVDRLRIELGRWKSIGEDINYYRVYLHGSDTVYEVFEEPLIKEDVLDTPQMQATNRSLRQKIPDAFEPHHKISKEHTLDLTTNERERLVRAWSYIYQHGCTGSKSPF